MNFTAKIMDMIKKHTAGDELLNPEGIEEEAVALAIAEGYSIDTVGRIGNTVYELVDALLEQAGKYL